MVTAAIIGATLIFLGLGFFAYVLYLTEGAEFERRDDFQRPRIH